MIVETVRCTDVQIPPPDYYRILRDACDRHGALLILDEVPIALGRTGTMFAFEHYGIVPDMVVLGKGLGGAVFPMAALIARARSRRRRRPIALGHYTHEKSSVGCAAALATLDVIEDERLLERSRDARRARARAGCGDLKERHRARRRRPRRRPPARHRAARADGRPARDEAERTMYECLARGLSFKVGQGNVLTLSPPLVIAEADLDAAFDILDAALSAVAEQPGRRSPHADAAQPAGRRRAAGLGHAHRAHRHPAPVRQQPAAPAARAASAAAARRSSPACRRHRAASRAARRPR